MKIWWQKYQILVWQRIFNEIDYYKFKDDQNALPIRWMSLEALQQNVYSKQSDVVSEPDKFYLKNDIDISSLSIFQFLRYISVVFWSPFVGSF